MIYYPDGRQEQVELGKPTVQLGRADDNDIVLNHDTVSQHHAQLLCDADDCQVLDLGSANGTFLIGVRLTPQAPQPLPDGALLQIGGIALTYRAPPNEREVGAAQANAASSSATMMLPIGAAPPLPKGVPATSRPMDAQSVPPPSAAPPANNDRDETMLLPIARPIAQPVPAPSATGDREINGATGMPAVQQPSLTSSSVPPVDAGAPPPSSAAPSPPKRGWGQPAHVVAAAPAVPQPRRASRWLLELGLVVLVAVIAAGVWLLLPGTTTEPLDSGTPVASARPSGDAATSPASASPADAASTAPTPDAAPPSTENSPPAQAAEYVVSAQGNDTLNVRDGPGEEFGILGALPNGTVIRVVEGPVAGGKYQWVRIESDTSKGWCILEALRPR